MSGPTASNPLDVCGVVVATCIGNDLKTTPRCCNCILIEVEKPHPAHTEAAAMRKENCKGEEHTTNSQWTLWEDVL
jgi:hypothetical protein